MGAHIRDARERRDLGVRQLAQKADVSVAWLSRVESGEIKKPGEDRLIRVARALDLDPLDLQERAGSLTPDERLRLGERLDVEAAIQADRRLTSSQRRLLIDHYREFVGSSR